MWWRTLSWYMQYSKGLCLLMGVRFCTELMYAIICSLPPAGFSILLEYSNIRLKVMFLAMKSST